MAVDIIHRRTSPSTQLSFLTNTLSSVSSIRRISILVHGWGCQATHFIPLIARLTANGENADHGYLYLAVDLPGHGESPASILPEPENGGMTELIVALICEVLHQQIYDHAPSGDKKRQSIPTVLYGHSMGTLVALELLMALQDHSLMEVSHLVLLDAAWTGEQTAEPLNYNDLRKTAIKYRESIQEQLSQYFGPRTSLEFESTTRAGFAGLDFEYALRMGHWYRGVEAKAAQTLQNLDAKNRLLLGSGDKPVRILIVQSQEAHGPDGRHSLVSGQSTAHMLFVRRHLASEWTQELVIEGTSHYPHVDDVDEVVECLAKFFSQ
ncbi:alpha/beta-hydrolase [Penicillium cinerascens]|uniref:Alpha/beta-hydrolase n=1 Tax=Penicillium cinerascens TaxID=70096 RepID=A0A9W9M6W2_9EURO|nr:alpha/beta-hydrolase [Penicillium cinerascens]KAJ5190929.1 alpha/beta-hydrolase [Penicillium cinerascens]